MDDIVGQVLQSGRTAADLVDTPAVRQRWDAPSILVGYRVGGLCGHLARALETTETYLSAPSPPASAPLPVDAPGYYATVLGDHDPIASDFHATVRARGERRLEDGPDAVLASMRAALDWFAATPVDHRGVVTVLDGTTMYVADYLRTRLVELVIHSVDLSRSVGVDEPAFPEDTWTTVAAVLLDTVVARSPARAIALGLARPDAAYPVSAFG